MTHAGISRGLKNSPLDCFLCAAAHRPVRFLAYGAEIVGQDKFALAMECVLSGEADCAINDELTYAYWKQQKGGEDSTKIVAESDNVNSSAIMVKKGNDELIEKLNSAIDELLADGTVKEISEKYFGMDVSQP